ncbi:MAG: thioredoxin family protein [Candidatus Micrarchaeia archaeon]
MRLIPILLLLLLLAGCTQKEEVTCNPPYIKVGIGCCLDADKNSICDSDEQPEKNISVPSNETPSNQSTCNPPYRIINGNCCLDANGNSICDEEEKTSNFTPYQPCVSEGEFVEFYGEGCPHCTAMVPVVSAVENETGVVFRKLEVWYNRTNNNELMKYKDYITRDCGVLGVPAFINIKTNKSICGQMSAADLKNFVLSNIVCETETPSNETEMRNETPSCSPPYILFGSACCIDENYNGVCDEREGVTSTPNLTITVSLPTPRCGDGFCYITENSSNCPADCGCPAGEILYNGSCARFIYVSNFSAMEVCGNKYCKPGVENSSNCCKDCGCPAGQVCSNNVCSNITYVPPSVQVMLPPVSYIVVVIDEITVHDDTDPAGAGELMLFTFAGSGDRVQKVNWPYRIWYSVDSGGKIQKRIPVFAVKESEMGDRLAISIRAVDNDELPGWLDGFLAVATAPLNILTSIGETLVNTADKLVSDAELELELKVNTAFLDAITGNEQIGAFTRIYDKNNSWGVRDEQYSVRGGGMTVKYSIKKVLVPRNSKLSVKVHNVTISDTGDYFDGEVWLWMRASTNFGEKDLSGVVYRFPEGGTWSLGDNAKIVSGSCTPNERGECITNPIMSFESNGPFIFLEVDAWDEDNPDIGDDHDNLGTLSFVYLYSDFDMPPTTMATTYADRIEYPWVITNKTITAPFLSRGNMKVNFELTRYSG